MNSENTQKLFTDFSDLYDGRFLPPSQNLMVFGFECDNGWFDLIYGLSEKISELDPNCRAVQVKEKFGGLRFYVGASTDEVFDLIDAAERDSYKVCELCGSRKFVDQTRGGWIKTLCLDCRKENGYDDEM